MSDNQEDYKSLLSDLIKKQIVMLGPQVALAKAKKIGLISVSGDGTVSEINGAPQEALSRLAEEYMSLSGQIANATIKSLLEKYPQIKNKTE